MTGEPKLENFLTNLADASFSLEELTKDKDELAELLWYLDGSRSKQVVTSLKEWPNKNDRENIIKNVVSLYPLSQYLVREILTDISGSDYYFIGGFDIEELTYKKLRERLKETQGQSVKTTKRFQEYQEDIDKLIEEANKLEADAEKFRDLKLKKEDLIARVNALRQETDEDTMRQIIAELEDEQRNLEWQKTRQEEMKQKHKKMINDIKLELQSNEKKLDESELELLRELIETFPPDAEDGK